MTLPDNISADHTLRPSELAEVLAVLVEARQPCMVWGGPGCGKSQVSNPSPAPASSTLRRLAPCRPGGPASLEIRGILDPDRPFS